MLLFNSKIYPYFNGKVVGLPSDWTAVMQARDARLPTIFARYVTKTFNKLKDIGPPSNYNVDARAQLLDKKRQRENRIYYLLSSVLLVSLIAKHLLQQNIIANSNDLNQIILACCTYL